MKVVMMSKNLPKFAIGIFLGPRWCQVQWIGLGTAWEQVFSPRCQPGWADSMPGWLIGPHSRLVGLCGLGEVREARTSADIIVLPLNWYCSWGFAAVLAQLHTFGWLFLVFSKVNTGSNCSRSDSSLSRISKTMWSWIRLSFRSQ